VAIAWACMIIAFGANHGTEAASSRSQEQGKAGFTTLSRIATGTFFLNIFSESSDIKALSWDAICSLADVEEGDFEGDDFSDIIPT
jgi:hypothetical protein